MYPLLKLLTTAQRHQLANPHITTVLPSNTAIKIVLSKKYAGSVNIYDKFTREYLAFIRADGTLFKLAICTSSVFKEILALHNDKDLVSTLAVTGRRVGWCCFCGLHLTNAISVFHGYGPICAGKYELPWEGEPKELLVSNTGNTKELTLQPILTIDDDII